MTKILFIGGASSWSRVVRLGVLARGLDPRRYEIHYASARFDERLLRHTISTLCRDAAEHSKARAEDSLPSSAADLNLRSPEQ